MYNDNQAHKIMRQSRMRLDPTYLVEQQSTHALQLLRQVIHAAQGAEYFVEKALPDGIDDPEHYECLCLSLNEGRPGVYLVYKRPGQIYLGRSLREGKLLPVHYSFVTDRMEVVLPHPEGVPLLPGEAIDTAVLPQDLDALGYVVSEVCKLLAQELTP